MTSWAAGFALDLWAAWLATWPLIVVAMGVTAATLLVGRRA